MPLVQAEIRRYARAPLVDRIGADFAARTQQGIATYGEPLRAHNGRHALVDAYQEALDLAQYLRQWLAEQAAQPWTLERHGLQEHYACTLRLCCRMARMLYHCED